MLQRMETIGAPLYRSREGLGKDKGSTSSHMQSTGVQLRLQAGKMEINLKEFPDARGRKGCPQCRRGIASCTSTAPSSVGQSSTGIFIASVIFSQFFSITLGNLKQLVINTKLLLISYDRSGQYTLQLSCNFTLSSRGGIAQGQSKGTVFHNTTLFTCFTLVLS